MIGLLCRVIGHQRTLVAFTSNRFSCRRCGADLGRDIPAMPSRPAASLLHAARPSFSPPPRRPPQWSRKMRLEPRGPRPLEPRPRRDGA
jgi:hypothetical protein